MSYKQMKWLILIIPTLTIGLWEYVRHEFLLPYISMDLGNLLAPVIVFLVSILFLTQLFSLIERNQEELNQARAMQAAMQERERIGRELHDGIAQSLFLLSAQVDRLEREGARGQVPYQEIKKSVHRTHVYVREAIANLRYPADPQAIPWMQSMNSLIEEIKQETNLHFTIQWNIPDTMLSAKEKAELLASIRESLLNIHKHAEAKHVYITASETSTGWRCTVSDDGKGFDFDKQPSGNRYGINIMKDRAKAMGWTFKIGRQHDRTMISIQKENAT
ncbi:histidine kinase [Bacillus sp. FJAT-18019]|uniref:histidine kinase n=1 Tax=Paenibacillus solani TaxID=1705565 RepID=A0A0M1P591_9BACL|nr:histidine kinase [Paenibacillus solani]KOP68008.1 histidine kinase [Bacillus sp. FJAT-18019]KOR89656.1 histidine kinase [Paenibacillus solani]